MAAGKRDRPGYHDPFAGVGGAAPAQSALTLRLVLAVMALVLCVGAAITFGVLGGPLWAVVLFAVVGATAAVDIVVVALRKARGERG